MDEPTFLRRCKDLAGDTRDGPWMPHHLAGFFQNFRPDGQRLELLFNEIPAGKDVYNRLRQVFRATAAGSQGPQGIDAYFIVRNPQPATLDNLARYAAAQVSIWRQMAVELNKQALVDLLTPIPEITIRNDAPPEPDPNDTESLDAFIYDVQTDWHSKLVPLCQHAWWMRKAFYYLACDYCLAGYVAWPWYMSSSQIKEPYKPYFNLWLHGAELRCKSPENIALFAPVHDNAT